MEFSEDEKRELLKLIVYVIKQRRGVGPQVHYVKYYENEFHICVEKTLTTAEKHLFHTYGKEYYDAVKKFYLDSVKKAIATIDQAFDCKFKLELINWEFDYLNDKIVYKVKHI